jgi:hypothetical protein
MLLEASRCVLSTMAGLLLNGSVAPCFVAEVLVATTSRGGDVAGAALGGDLWMPEQRLRVVVMAVPSSSRRAVAMSAAPCPQRAGGGVAVSVWCGVRGFPLARGVRSREIFIRDW